MKELDQLVENFFQPKRDTLGLDQLVEMIEQVMNERKEELGEIAEKIIAILKAEKDEDGNVGSFPVFAPDATLKGKVTGKTITLDNTGSRGMRASLLNNKLGSDDDFDVEIVKVGDGTTAKVSYQGGQPFSLVLKQGSVPESIANIGNFAEGVTAYALAERVIQYKSGYDQTKTGDLGYPQAAPEDISIDDIKKLSNEIEWDTVEKKGDKRTLKKKRFELDDGDFLELAIGLDNITWKDLDNIDKWSFAESTVASAVRFANSKFSTGFIDSSMDGIDRKKKKDGDVIYVTADGVSDQEGTTADLNIQMKTADGNYIRNLKTGKISLKTKNTKQLGQAGKKKKDSVKKFVKFFSDLYDYHLTPQELDDFKTLPREDLFGKTGYFSTLFDSVKNRVENMSTPKEESFIRRLSRFVVDTAGGPDITLIKLLDDDYVVYDLAKEIVEDFDIKLEKELTKSGIPYLYTYIVGRQGTELAGTELQLVVMRPRRDADGFRFYVEQGKDYNAFYKYERDQVKKEKEQQEENPLTNPPQ